MRWFSDTTRLKVSATLPPTPVHSRGRRTEKSPFSSASSACKSCTVLNEAEPVTLAMLVTLLPCSVSIAHLAIFSRGTEFQVRYRQAQPEIACGSEIEPP